MAILIIKKREKITWVEQDVEKLEPLHIAGGIVKSHLSLVSEDANSVQPEAHFFVLHEAQTGGSCKCLT